MQFLTTEPLWLSGTLLLGVATLLAMASPVLVRRRVSLDWLRLNNEVAGFKFATVGELYTVLLAFAMIVVWEKFSEAESAVTQEAGAPATLYRLADGIGGEPSTALRDGVTRYLREAIAEDWPAMERGGASRATTRALDAAYAALLTFTPSDGRGTALLAEALDQLHVVTQARRVRLVLAPGVVPGVLWFVLFGGAALTVGFTLFFGTENLRVQAMMTGGPVVSDLLGPAGRHGHRRTLRGGSEAGAGGLGGGAGGLRRNSQAVIDTGPRCTDRRQVGIFAEGNPAPIGRK